MSNVLTKFEREFGLTVDDKGKVVTNSIRVAEYYGKQHKDVLEKIRGFITLIPQLDRRNFTLIEYKDERNRKQPMFMMDRQGFSMLVNKFTGDEATLFTYRYTQAFEEMAEEIAQRREQMLELTDKAVTNNGLTLYEFNESRFGTPQRRRLALMDASIDGRDSVFTVYNDLKDYMSKRTAKEKLTALLHAERVLIDKQDAYGNDIAFVYKIEELLRQVAKDIDKLRNWQNGAVKRELNKENKKLKEKVDYLNPSIEQMHQVDYHPFSENSMYDLTTFGDRTVQTKSKSYLSWLSKFPVEQLPSIFELDVDFNRPVELICLFDHIKKFDVINLDKSFADLLANHYNFNDNVIFNSTQKTNNYVKGYGKGKIYFLLRNI